MIGLIRRIARFRRHPKSYDLIIYKPDRIGDFVLAISSIRLLLSNFKGQSVLLVLSPSGKLLADEFFADAEVCVLNSGCELRQMRQFSVFMRELFQLLRLDSKQVISLKHHKREVDMIYERAIQCDKLYSCLGDLSVTFFRSLCVNPQSYPDSAPEGYCRELVAHYQLLDGVLDSTIKMEEVLPSFEPSVASASSDIVISPFGSDTKRDLRPDQVLSHLPADGLAGIVLIGSPAQIERLRVFAGNLSGMCANKVTVETFTTLRGYINAVRDADYVISTETATAHLAVASGKPGVCFLGGGHYGYFAPWGGGEFLWLSSPMECFNCNWHCKHDTIRCLNDL